MFANLYKGFSNICESAGDGIKDDTVVQYPLAIRKHRLCASILFSTNVSFHRLQVHWAVDIVLICWKLQRIHCLEEGFDISDRLHPIKGVFEQSTELIHSEKPHGSGPGVHVLCSHDEDTLRTHPVLGGARLHLYALDVEHPGAGLAANNFAFFVTEPAVTVAVHVRS